MPPTRLFYQTGLAAAGCALLAAATSAVQPGKDDLPPQPSKYIGDLNGYKAGRGISKEDLPKAKEAFTAVAKYFADSVAHPRLYAATQEFRDPFAPGAAYNPDRLVTDLARLVLVPTPQAAPPVGDDQLDYIREFGAAFDAALKPLVLNGGDQVVRVNATRLLAVACRSGAAVHYPTVIELLTDPNTPPTVKFHAFHAAAALLAAYDPLSYQSRRHSTDGKTVGTLVAVLQDAVTKPNSILATAGGSLPPDQAPVAAFIRRQAVRALAQVRFAEKVPGGPDQYPAFTLARVALFDPALVPPATAPEAAEAAMGICNMAPPRGAGVDTAGYGVAMADVVATGIVNFATRRGADEKDKSLPWRAYAARLNDALKGWPPLFDPVYNPLQPKQFNAGAAPKAVTDLVKDAEQRVLAPMDGLGRVDVAGLIQFRNNTLRADKKWTLTPFSSNPKLALPKK